MRSQKRRPLSWCLYKVGDFYFWPLIIDAPPNNRLIAELAIALSWRGQRGVIIERLASDGIDLDNRLKVLLDALALPQDNQVKGKAPSPDEIPLYCLLENDNLVTDLSISTAKLDTVPRDDEPHEYVEATIKVRIKRADDLTENEF